MEAINLDGRVMSVSTTDKQGVVGAGTRLYFTQRGSRVLARYHGGSVRRGYLVGDIQGSELAFRYTQVEISGQIHGGSSVCEVQCSRDGLVRLLEHFSWHTRRGCGTNVFDEIR